MSRRGAGSPRCRVLSRPNTSSSRAPRVLASRVSSIRLPTGVITVEALRHSMAAVARQVSVIGSGREWEDAAAEIGFARRLGRPVVLLEGAPSVPGVELAKSPLQAVERALELLGA